MGTKGGNLDKTAKLEERIAHLTRTMDDISEIVSSQSAEIERLTRRVSMLLQREAEREAEGGGGVIIGDEKPPHY